MATIYALKRKLPVILALLVASPQAFAASDACAAHRLTSSFRT